MQGAGPLSLQDRFLYYFRYFMGMLAVSAYGCDYLYKRLEK